MDEILWFLLAAAGLIAAVVAMSQVHRVDSDLRSVRRRLAELETQVKRLAERPAAPAAEAVAPAPAAAPPKPVAEEAAAQPPEPIPVETPPPAEEPAATTTPVFEPEIPARPAAAAKPAAAPQPPKLAAERALTERWLVWLGGLALALGGAFMVKLSIDQGLLGPEVRVMLGALGGAGLMAAGHWLRGRAVAGQQLPGQVPPVLVGAGGSMLFVSIYAAHALYHMIGQLPAFGGLALVAAAIAMMSVAHGQYVALLALVGAYAVPVLVRSNEPNVIGLFSYLSVVSAGLLALLRWRAWTWLAWVVLAASVGWTVIWLFGPWQRGDEAIVGGYLLVLFGLFAAFRLGIPQVPALAGRIKAPLARRLVLIAVMVIAATMVPVAGASGFSHVGLALPLLLAAACVAFGWRDPDFDTLPAIGTLALLGVLALWEWPQPQPFAVVTGLGAVVLGCVTFVIALRAPRPWVWAAVSAAAPNALLAMAYWRLSPVAPDWGWSIAALLLAALNVATAERFNRHRAQDGMEAALAAAATGAIAATALAATFALSEAWLSVALAMLVAGIAWIEGMLRVSGLRKVALVVAGVVVVRLVANPSLLNYALPPGSLVNWLVYGYGLPAVAFAVAARLFRRGGEDVLVGVLEAGAVTFATLLVSLEIHVRLGGGMDFAQSMGMVGYGLDLPLLNMSGDSRLGFIESSLNTLAWSAGAAMLFLLCRRGGSRVLLVCGWVLWGLATFTATMVLLLAGNPLYTGTPVGEGAVFNLLLLAYAAPAALYAVHAMVAPEQPVWGRRANAALALVMIFAWASLEVRHAFVGSILDAEPVGQAEMWVYSVVWLLGGVAMLGAGILRRSVLLRRAGLGVVLLVVAKVFIVDMAELHGLWRALSFLGLGGVLVGIGGLYRRFAKYI